MLLVGANGPFYPNFAPAAAVQVRIFFWKFFMQGTYNNDKQMKCKTYGISKSFFFNLRVFYCTPNLFKFFKLGQNAPSICRVQQASGIMIVFKYFFFKRFSIKFCIWKSNRFFFYWLDITHKNGPKVKKGGMKVKKLTLKLE